MNEVIIEETYEHRSMSIDNIYRVLDRDGRQIYAGLGQHGGGCTRSGIVNITNHSGQPICKWDRTFDGCLHPAADLVSQVGSVHKPQMNIPCGCCCCCIGCVEQPNKWTIYDPSGAVAMYKMPGPGRTYLFYAQDGTTPIGELMIERLNGFLK